MLVALLALVVGANSIAAQETPPPPWDLPGRILFAQDWDIWVWEMGESYPLTTGRVWRQPQWSPDGQRIAFTLWADNFSDIYVMSADGSEMRQLTQSRGRFLDDNDWATRPMWSPDGARIAYLSDINSMFPMLWVMDADGRNRRQLFRPVAGIDAVDSFSWSPDGASIAMTAFRGSTGQVYRLDLARPGSPRQLTDHPGGALDPAWSPDGQWVAYAGRDSGSMGLYLIDPEGAKRRRLLVAPMLRAPVWSPDARYLACLVGDALGLDIMVLELGADAEGHVVVSRRYQLTRSKAVDGPSGLSWGP